MNLFFCDDIKGEFAYFSEEESAHCVQVLRRRPGDQVQFIDGIGNWFEANILEATKRNVVAQITAKHLGTDHQGYRLHMAVAPLKNMDRFEWFVEKATEIGVDELTPLATKYTERSKIRVDRLEKIVLSAAKQCLRTRLPKVNQLIDFESFMKGVETKGPASRFIPHCQKSNLPHLQRNCPKGADVLVLIGPEGDFSTTEVERAIALGFEEVGLGANRLRTETAAIVACHTVHLVNLR